MEMPDLSVLEKTLNNEAGREEARYVVRWLATPEGQAWLSQRMDMDEKAVALGDEARWADHPIPSAVMYQRIMKQLRRRRIRRWVMYGAAILIPLVLFVGLFMQVDSRVNLLSEVEYDEVYVPNGERMQVLFQDGSKVHLNSGSRIRYPKQFGLSERRVQLEGEAWFEVAKNRNRPFVVDLSCLDVRVLGTTFDVKAYPDEEAIFVALESGSVELKSKTLKDLLLKPGEKAFYNRASGRCEVARSRNVAAYSAWRRNVLVFKDAPLSEVMATLSRTYNIAFTVADSTALQYTYTLTTDSAGLPAVLKDLEKITPVRFIEQQGQIEVRIK